MARALVLVVLILGGCVDTGPREVDEPCMTSADCEADARCVPVPRRAERCMRVCEEDERLCADGSVCLATPSEVSVCYLGGEMEEGTACERSDTCARGLVCVLDDSSAGFCRRACDRRAVSCRANERCALAGEEPRGYCAAEPGA